MKEVSYPEAFNTMQSRHEKMDADAKEVMRLQAVGKEVPGHLRYPREEMVEIDGVPNLKITIDASTVIYKPQPENKIVRRGRHAKQLDDKPEPSDGRDGLSDA